MPEDVQSQAVAIELEIPAKVTSLLLAQTVWSTLAFTLGASVIVTIIKLLTGLQIP